LSVFRQDFIGEVAVLIRDFCAERCTRNNADRLIRLAARIAAKNLYGRLYAAAQFQDTAVDNLAMSVVSGLFIRRGEVSPLASAMKDLLQGDDLTIFLKFRTIAINMASQELFHRWPENDAVGAKLWRNIHRIIRQDDLITIFPAERPVWVTLKKTIDQNGCLEIAGHGEILRILNGIGAEHKNLSETIYSLLTQIAEDDHFQGAIRIDTLFSALRIYTGEINSWTQHENAYPKNCDPNLSILIGRAIQRARSKMDKILDKYKRDGKLDARTKIVFRKALDDIIEDLPDGGQAQSYFDYLKFHDHNMEHDYYRSNLRARFEYLAEIAAEEFIAEMRKQCI